MTPDEVRAVIFGFPGVEEGFSLGSVHFKVNGKVLTRMGVRTGPDALQIMEISPDEGEMLIAADPAVFHTTPHFRDARCILARGSVMDPEALRGFLERRWRKIAPRAAVKTWDTERRGD